MGTEERLNCREAFHDLQRPPKCKWPAQEPATPAPLQGTGLNGRLGWRGWRQTHVWLKPIHRNRVAGVINLHHEELRCLLQHVVLALLLGLQGARGCPT
jgi:hypothetical protein